MIAPTAIIRGVGLETGIDLLDDVEGMTGYYDSNLDGKFERAAREFIENKNQYDYGFVHVKGVDDAGHDKSEKIKIEQIEKADRALAKLVDMLQQHVKANPHEDFIVCVTGDHTTPVAYGDHSAEPVPIIMGQVSKIYEINDKVSTFDELCCGRPDSPLGRFHGIQIVPLLKRYR